MRAKLLFVDDDVAVCDVMGALLTKRDFDVVCVHGGADALRALEHDEFDAVVSDLNMPDMSGLELCRRLLTLKRARERARSGSIGARYTETQELRRRLSDGTVPSGHFGRRSSWQLRATAQRLASCLS